MTSPSVPIKGLQEGQEDLAATDTGSLLRRGIKFSSQDAVNRSVLNKKRSIDMKI